MGILGGGVPPPVLQILTLAISDHVIFHTRFQTWPLLIGQKLCYHY